MNIQVSISGIPPMVAKAAFILLLAALELGDLSTLLAVALVLSMRSENSRKQRSTGLYTLPPCWQLKAAKKDRSWNSRDATIDVRNRAINPVAKETNHDRRHTKTARPDQSSH